jgi:hypothetical protein
MSINNNTDAHEVRPKKLSSPKISRKLQLWTNQSKTKYAISFEDELHYLATTDPKVLQYTTLIADSDRIFRGYEYNWKSILNKWIDIHKFTIGFRKRSKFPFTSMTSSEDRFKIKNTLKVKTESKSSFNATTMGGKKYSVRLKPYIKCHFCKLLFETNNKRTTHEREWHSN